MIQFIDLKKQYKLIQENIETRFRDIMSGTRFIMGKEVNELEMILAEYVGTKYCLTCASGTDALQIALMVLNIGAGDAVFVPSFTFYSTAEVVNLVGATPIFVDVDEKTFNMDPDKLETAINNVTTEGRLNPRVVIPVDLFGLPADYLRINKIAEKHNLIVIEDGAQGFGGRLNLKKACSFGHISTTSFFPSKPLGCYGDGGAIFTDDDSAAILVDSIRCHGKGNDKYQNIRVGLNSRLDTLQAAVLLEKMEIFNKELSMRNRIANLYCEGLKDILSVPQVKSSIDCTFYSSWAQYSLLANNEKERTIIIDGLKKREIPTMVYYTIPLHMQEVYKRSDNRKDYCDLRVSEDICRRVFSLPMHPYLEESEIEYIIQSIKDVLNYTE